MEKHVYLHDLGTLCVMPIVHLITVLHLHYAAYRTIKGSLPKEKSEKTPSRLIGFLVVFAFSYSNHLQPSIIRARYQSLGLWDL